MSKLEIVGICLFALVLLAGSQGPLWLALGIRWLMGLPI